MLLFTIKVRLGAKTFAAMVRILGPILSTPVDFFTFKLVIIFFFFLQKLYLLMNGKFSVACDFRFDIILLFFEVRMHSWLFNT